MPPARLFSTASQASSKRLTSSIRQIFKWLLACFTSGDSMKFDLATISGVIIATVGLVVGLRSEGLQFSDMSQLTAIFVVFFGTAGAVLISMPVEQTKKALRMLPGMIRNPNELDRDVIELILRYAKAARLGGLLSLETEIRAIEDPYLRSAMQLAVDSVNVESIKVVLESEVAGLR